MARRSKSMAQKRRRDKANKKKYEKNASRRSSFFPKKQSKLESSFEIVEFFATIFRPLGSIFRWFD